MKASDVDNSVLVKWMAVNRPSFTNFFGQIDPDHIYNIKITSWLNYRFDQILSFLLHLANYKILY